MRTLMNINLTKFSQGDDKNSLIPDIFFYEACQQICKEVMTDFRVSDFSELKNSHRNNAPSDSNVNNVFARNSRLVKADSFIWPEVNMSMQSCYGHECLDHEKDINKKILYQPSKRILKPKFTPPTFAKSGIIPCPNVPTELIKKKVVTKSKKHPSVLEDDMWYMTPGNMEFIDFTYPKILHAFRYSTFAIPNNRFEWEWIYSYVQRIKNSFRRKYHCEVGLSSEPGVFKGHIAYLVRIESDNQGNILRCRSGLPKILSDIIVVPQNAVNDVDCYITEYLIKRKYIFKKPSSYDERVKLLMTDSEQAEEIVPPAAPLPVASVKEIPLPPSPTGGDVRVKKRLTPSRRKGGSGKKRQRPHLRKI